MVETSWYMPCSKRTSDITTSPPTLYKRHWHTISENDLISGAAPEFLNNCSTRRAMKTRKGRYTQTHRPHGTLAMLISNSLHPSVPVVPLSLSPALRRAKAWCWIRLCSAAPLHPPSPWVVGWCAISFFKIARSVKTFSPSRPTQNSSNLRGCGHATYPKWLSSFLWG